MRSKEAQSGQALLIAILVASVLLTIGLSLTSTTIQETKIAKLQEDSSRARAAAEAGIDYVLDQEPVGQIQLQDILPENDDITGTAEIILEAAPTFTTPLLAKDMQYTMYLTGYDSQNHEVTDGNFTDSILVERVLPENATCGTNSFAVELTFINVNEGIVTRRLIDQECDVINGMANESDLKFGDTIDTSTFSASPQVMIVRVIAPDSNFEGAKIKFTRQSGQDWAAQGRSVISEATTGGNVTKKIKLFQSYPQFPTEFFVTTF
jgi:type II secretory pathway pseudopilin PulG